MIIFILYLEKSYPLQILYCVLKNQTFSNFVSSLYQPCGSCGSSLVSLEVFPQHKSCWSCRQLLYVSLFFVSPLFSQSRISKSVVICSFCSFLCSFLLSIFSLLLFSTLVSIPCSVFSFCLFTLFSDHPYCFLFKSVIPSFLFPYYSVLSASPLCSITIQSVLFLLVFIFLDPSI